MLLSVHTQIVSETTHHKKFNMQITLSHAEKTMFCYFSNCGGGHLIWISKMLTVMSFFLSCFRFSEVFHTAFFTAIHVTDLPGGLRRVKWNLGIIVFNSRGHLIWTFHFAFEASSPWYEIQCFKYDEENLKSMLNIYYHWS